MKTRLFVWLAAGFLTSIAHAQDAPPAATPPPLPPPPWIKRAPAFSQWIVAYSRDEPPAKSSKPVAAGSEKKSVQAVRTQDIVLETTTRANGAVIQHYFLKGQLLTQVNKTGGWVTSSSGGGNGFNDADYKTADFAGFGWISAKNYVGVQPVNNRKCLVFQDKVVTLEEQELNLIRSSSEQAVNDWEAEQLRESAAAKNPAPSPAANKKGGAQAGAEPAKPAVATPRPPNFNIEDYKVTVTAYVDADSGMPVALTYKSLQGTKEGRTYVFQDPPTTALDLPPEVQSSEAMSRAVSSRMTSRGAVP